MKLVESQEVRVWKLVISATRTLFMMAESSTDVRGGLKQKCDVCVCCKHENGQKESSGEC